FVRQSAPAEPVGAGKSGDSALRADRAITKVKIVLNGSDGFVYVGAVGVTVNHHRIPRRPSEELIDRNIENFSAYVPESSVNRADCRHRHRPATPIGTLVKVLPCVFDSARVAPDQERDQMVIQIA